MVLDYIARAAIVLLSIILLGKYASVLIEGCDRVLHVLIFEINPKFYVAIIILTALLLLLLAINMRKTDENIQRHSYVNYKTEDEYENEKAYLTKKHLNELKKHPKYNQIRLEAIKSQKERAEASVITDRPFTGGSMFVYEESD